MRGVEDDDVSVRTPAVNAILKTSDCLKGEECNISTLSSDVDKTFAIFSAIKRCVMLARRKAGVTSTLAPSDSFTRSCVGFTTEAAKESVRLSCSFLILIRLII